MNDYKRTENKILFPLLIVTSCLAFSFGQISIHTAQAHLEHLPHYNAGESRIGYGNYMSFMVWTQTMVRQTIPPK